MSKQLELQRYIFKIHSSRLRDANWKLTLSIDDARKNDEIISLASSQVLRWIDELNGMKNGDDVARGIRKEIKVLRSEPNSPENKRKIKQLYNELDKYQYKPDYMCLIVDKPSDYHRACDGFSINGITYKRLLGTAGGIKNSTIVFVSDKHVNELRRRIDNDRNPEVEFTTAKLEAYKALACSASSPVSMPNGVLIVKDFETTFEDEVINLSSENDGEPEMSDVVRQSITIQAVDGCGMMCPALARRWAGELGLDYVPSGVNTRFSFEKGMVFTFDFHEFADNIAHKYIVKDAWGDEVDIRNVELVLTTSMVKLWDSYPSCDEYIRRSVNNGYTFGITKTAPIELENERSLNYQFIQSYDLSDDDIRELLKPTVDEIHDVLGGDWRKAVLFLKGSGLKENSGETMDNDFVKALMIDQRMMNDQYVVSRIKDMIKGRITDAKVGVVKVHGNYSILSGDLYGLCQSMFGLKITGLLNAGEIYNGYWDDDGASQLACFRAPMTCHNNIRKVKVCRRDSVRHWYRYMKTCTVFNSWDTAMIAMNGCDFDGDIALLTDNKVLVDKLIPSPALVCGQRKAAKKVPTETDFIKSNIESFGNDIGQTTNWITSMFEVQSKFEKGSREYNELAYRIKCGQQAQQDCIDRTKGIICKPMTKSWHDRHDVFRIEDDSKREFYDRIVADRKPYFMRYIYPSLMKEYNRFIRATEQKCKILYDCSPSDLISMEKDELTDEQSEFVRYYNIMMPVGTGNCVMNKVCRMIEKEFDHLVEKKEDKKAFDYTIMKSGTEYTSYQYNEIKKLYDEYSRHLKSYATYAKKEHVDRYDISGDIAAMDAEFAQDCQRVCPDKYALCDIVLDICYKKSGTKKFAWSISGNEIIHNLLQNTNGTISIPIMNDDGDIEFGGNSFSIITKEIDIDTWE